MAITIVPVTAANGNFGPLGSAAWGAGMQLAGATAGSVLFVGADGVSIGQDATNFSYATTSGPRLQVGSGSSTSVGWLLGYSGTSGYACLWPTSTATPSISNYSFLAQATLTSINVPSATGTIDFRINGTTKGIWTAAVGSGLSITAGIATTDVAAFSVARTNNDASVATGVKIVFTDTASAAGFLALQILGGAAGTTNLISVSKAGLVDAPAYAAGGTAGADFGPGLPTSITVKKGIITAIS